MLSIFAMRSWENQRSGNILLISCVVTLTLLLRMVRNYRLTLIIHQRTLWWNIGKSNILRQFLYLTIRLPSQESVEVSNANVMINAAGRFFRSMGLNLWRFPIHRLKSILEKRSFGINERILML